MKGTISDIHHDLINKCRKGDRRAQYAVYKLYAKAMYNICICMIPDKSEAEDILQEVFVNAFTKINSFKGEASFGSWLKRIVINQCISYIRKHKPMMVELNTEIIEVEADGFEEDTLTIKPEAIHEAIKNLPEGSRIVFNLYSLEGFKYWWKSQIFFRCRF